MSKGSISFSNEEEELLFKAVLEGRIHLFNLPASLYNKIALELTDAVLSSFSLTPETNLLNPGLELPRQLKRNLYVFSAAKTFNQIKDMQNFLFNEKGFKRPFNEFKQAAKQIFDTYNVNWLEAEFETATRQAESAQEFERLQAEQDIFPLLRYKTLEDGSVREEHVSLNNIVKPVNDSLWDKFTPPNGWRCRCFLEQLEEDQAQETNITTQKGGKTFRTKGRKREEITQPDKLFSFNPAKKGVIFREDAQGKGNSHPYFKVEQRFEVHKRNNFGLPLPPDVSELTPL